MQLRGKNLFKTNSVFTSAARNTSCSRGWLRFLTECLFGLVTVASFILIVLMAVRQPQITIDLKSRCQLQGCRIICFDTPYFGEYEEEIVVSVSIASAVCSRLFLVLNEPQFVNSTIPARWLSSMRSNVYELLISGGNLKHIESNAFMTSFAGKIQILIFENVSIMKWHSDMLVGLSNLKRIDIKRSYIGYIMGHALEPVDDTLESLRITNSGEWNPTNLTGSSNLVELDTVTFSSNNFSNILNEFSFSGLNTCKTLFLDNSKIIAIREHTFDNLHQIEVLYLNNNLLATIPYGLFDIIIRIENPTARVHLQDNFLLCDCYQHDLRTLSRKGMLVVDPICFYPDEIRGHYVSILEERCAANEQTTIKSYRTTQTELEFSNNVWNHIITNGSCQDDNGTKVPVRLISPIISMVCATTRFRGINYEFHSSKEYLFSQTTNTNDIISPTFSVKRDDFSMVEITANNKGLSDYGLLWYQSKCPNEIYCLNVLPNFLRLYNIDEDTVYMFCPHNVRSGDVEREKCITYSLLEDTSRLKLRWFFVTISGAAFVVFGALSVLMLVRRFPVLLKGSKRIMFVKHKKVDALILPPQVPLRPSEYDKAVPEFIEKGIFMSDLDKNKHMDNFMRSKSMRSSKSMTPSYISAFEPTEDQLAEWRLRNLDNISTETTLSSGLSTNSVSTDEVSLYSIGLSSAYTYTLH